LPMSQRNINYDVKEYNQGGNRYTQKVRKTKRKNIRAKSKMRFADN